jgi:hypothetical protein
LYRALAKQKPVILQTAHNAHSPENAGISAQLLRFLYFPQSSGSFHLREYSLATTSGSGKRFALK